MDNKELRTFRGGVNQRGVREHNERLMLSMIQRNGPMPGSDIARLAGLSPQTVSVILRQLESDGFVFKGEPVRGKVGKPSVPIALSPDGVLSVGLKIGRRSGELLLMDFMGGIRKQIQTTYKYPLPKTIFSFVEDGLRTLTDGLSSAEYDRICGIGVAAPFEIWKWHDSIGAPKSEFEAWRDIDFVTEIAKFSDLPVFVENDATAACRAEHVHGRGREFRDYAYFFVGAFIGGGVVLNDSVFVGNRGNAGAFGSLPALDPTGKTTQLIDTASIYQLERKLEAAGIEPRRLWGTPQDWTGFPSILTDWIDATARQLALAAQASCSIIDFEAVIIDGGFPASVRKAIVARTREHFATLDLRGLLPPQIEEGTVGTNARAVGAASVPIISQYLMNTNAGFA